MTPLAAFLTRQLEERNLTADEFSKKAGLARSHIYFILQGVRLNPRADTLDKIAAGLGMTPAEMAVAMGRGEGELSAEEAEVLAIYRQVPDDARPAVRGMLRGLAIPPTSRAAKGRADAEANAKKRNLRRLSGEHDGKEEDGPNSTLRAWSPSPLHVLRSVLVGQVGPIAERAGI